MGTPETTAATLHPIPGAEMTEQDIRLMLVRDLVVHRPQLTAHELVGEATALARFIVDGPAVEVVRPMLQGERAPYGLLKSLANPLMEQGMGPAEIARRIGCGRVQASNLLHRLRKKAGVVTPKSPQVKAMHAAKAAKRANGNA